MGNKNLFRASPSFSACATSILRLMGMSLLLSCIIMAASVMSKPLVNNSIRFRRLPPKEFSATVGSRIIVECEAGGTPPPTIYWLKDGQKLIQSDFENSVDDNGKANSALEVIGLSATRSRLHIDCLNGRDEGVYTCVAENAFSRVSANTNLVVMQPQPRDFNDNDSADEAGSSLDVMAALELGSAEPSPASPAATDSANSKDLAAVPQCSGKSSSGPVRIHMWTHNRLENMYNNVLLFCRSNRLRAPTKALTSDRSSKDQHSTTQFTDSRQTPISVTWLTPDDKVIKPDNTKYEILETGDLIIHDLRWTDMGSYTCTVSDEHSTDSVAVFVYPTKCVYPVFEFSSDVSKVSKTWHLIAYTAHHLNHHPEFTDIEVTQKILQSGWWKRASSMARLMIEKNGPHEHKRIPINVSRHYGSPDAIEKSTTKIISSSGPINDGYSQGDPNRSVMVDRTSIGEQDRTLEYNIKWNNTNPVVERILSENDRPVNNTEHNLSREYKLVAKIVNLNHNHPSSAGHKQQSTYMGGKNNSSNYSLNQPVKWNNDPLLVLSDPVSPQTLYNHIQNSVSSHHHVMSDINNINTDNHNPNNQPSNNIDTFKTVYIMLERVCVSSTTINVNQSPVQPPTMPLESLSTVNGQQQNISQPSSNSRHEHILGIVTLDERSQLVTIKPDFDKHLEVAKSWEYNFPKFTYCFKLVDPYTNSMMLPFPASLISPFEAEINLVLSILRPQLNQEGPSVLNSKKVFSSPIHGSILTSIKLEIQYAHSLSSRNLNNFYVRYRLFRLPPPTMHRGGENRPLVDMIDADHNLNIYLDGQTVTSLPNHKGRYHFCCVEQILIESKKMKINEDVNNHHRQEQRHATDEEEQLYLLMEFYSGDFFREKFEGWAFVAVPRSCSNTIIETDIINYDLYSIIDRIRYHLVGTLPQGIGDIENVVLAKNRYLLPTRFSGKIVISYEAVQQVSDLDLDKATIELLKIGNIETRMVKIDIESVIRAYKMARKKLEALEC